MEKVQAIKTTCNHATRYPATWTGVHFVDSKSTFLPVQLLNSTKPFYSNVTKNTMVVVNHVLALVLVVIHVLCVRALNNGLALTPPSK